MIEIRTRFGYIVYQSEKETIKEAVEEAIEKKISLCCTYLHNASLANADLNGADLCSADLSGADLRGANLNDTVLCSANLTGADLHDASLRCACLRGTSIRGADLRGDDLIDADLRNAELTGIKTNEYTNGISMQCPSEGSFIGWKKAEDYIVKLLITADAKRSSSTTRKCRCSKAKVLSIQHKDGTKTIRTKVCSNSDEHFFYEIGKTIEVKDFDEDRWNECSTGIHFFIDRNDAVNY